MRAVLLSEPISLSYYVCSMLDTASIRAHVTWARLALPMWLAGADTIEGINFLRMWNERSIDLSSSPSHNQVGGRTRRARGFICRRSNPYGRYSRWRKLAIRACSKIFCFLYIEQRVNVRGKADE